MWITIFLFTELALTLIIISISLISLSESFFKKKKINNSLGEDEDNVNNNADRGLN